MFWFAQGKQYFCFVSRWGNVRKQICQLLERARDPVIHTGAYDGSHVGLKVLLTLKIEADYTTTNDWV